MLIAQAGDHLVPMGGITQHRRGDPAAAWAGEQAGHRVTGDGIQPRVDKRADFLDQRDGTGALALGAFVDETTRAWSCLPPNRSGPAAAVDVGTAYVGDLAYPGRGEWSQASVGTGNRGPAVNS